MLTAAFRKPLVVADSSWADSIPGWLRQRVTVERLMQAYGKEKGLATDAEAVCYLYTAAMRAPLDHEHTNIYLHLAGKLIKQEGREVPADIDVRDLSSYEQDCLARLKRQIWEGAEREVKKGEKK